MAFTVIMNLLMLMPPLYMMQVYDRVLTSGNVVTLIMLLAGTEFSSLMHRPGKVPVVGILRMLSRTLIIISNLLHNVV